MYNDGKDVKATFAVVDANNNKLEEGRDYTVEYKDNKNVGTATITITGKGSYEGTLTTTFKIVGELINGKFDKKVIADQVYTGNEIKPEVKFTPSPLKLEEGKDYEIVYVNNVNSYTATGKENLDIIRRILGPPASSVDEALELVGLSEFGNRLAKKYSLGMKQRLGLASALLGEPPILILDEPTNGLDIEGIIEMRNLIKKLSQQGMAILISSHNLTEIDNLCNRIIAIKDGKIVTNDYKLCIGHHINGRY